MHTICGRVDCKPNQVSDVLNCMKEVSGLFVKQSERNAACLQLYYSAVCLVEYPMQCCDKRVTDYQCVTDYSVYRRV